jgi:hypothetical protein
MPKTKTGPPFVWQYVTVGAGDGTLSIDVQIFDRSLGEWSVWSFLASSMFL